MTLADMTIKTPEQVSIAQTRIALETDDLLHQPSISLKLAFQLLYHAVHAYQTAYRLKKLKSILEIRIALTRNQRPVECLGLTGIPVSYRPPLLLVNPDSIQPRKEFKVLVYSNPGDCFLATAFFGNAFLTSGNHIFYCAPLLGAKKVVNGAIPQCCILVCRHKRICKC